MSKHLLEIQNLRTVFHMEDGDVCAIDGVSMHVDDGEIVSIVGESGSGKSVTMLSMLKLIQSPGEVVDGQVLFEGRDLMQFSATSKEMSEVRGGKISMIFQEPMTSLNPVLTIGQQIEETIVLHQHLTAQQAKARAAELMELVGIPDGRERLGYYPAQFSGGMRQRIMIAMAMANNPKILIADEATTALDVTMQEQILELLRDIVRKTNTALIIITHNLSVVARYADRVYVMYAGNVVEYGTTLDIFTNPAHPYAYGLLNAIPRLDSDKKKQLIAIEGMPLNPAQRDDKCPFRNRCRYAGEDCACQPNPPLHPVSNTHGTACYRDIEALRSNAANSGQDELPRKAIQENRILEIQSVSKYFPVYKGLLRRQTGMIKALNGVSFSIHEGETLGLVGESGCGKTTLAKSILKLHNVTEGRILYNGIDITSIREKQMRPLRKSIQFIFQDPFGSLDPRQTAGNIVGEPLLIHKLVSGDKAYQDKVTELFEAVGLDPAMRNRVPHEFSGGQRQRIGIARALASEPSLIICDEPISALDVSIQAQIINLLLDLQIKRGLTYLFIAHDLSVVRHISDRIVVMYLGMIMEISPCNELYTKPMHPYTQALLSAIPIPDPIAEQKRTRIQIQGEVPSLTNRPSGCVFHTRCPYATEQCAVEAPALTGPEDGHRVACWQVNKKVN